MSSYDTGFAFGQAIGGILPLIIGFLIGRAIYKHIKAKKEKEEKGKV